MYPEELITMMETELTEVGFTPLRTPEEVTQHIETTQGTTLLFVNSLCGCAGTGAREGLKIALAASNHQPDHLVTVFAGIHNEATEQAFSYTKPYPPSSPAIALLKDGALVYFVERHQIKGNSPELIAEALQEALTACHETPIAS